jgi:hypothetical protein
MILPVVKGIKRRFGGHPNDQTPYIFDTFPRSESNNRSRENLHLFSQPHDASIVQTHIISIAEERVRQARAAQLNARMHHRESVESFLPQHQNASRSA